MKISAGWVGLVMVFAVTIARGAEPSSHQARVLKVVGSAMAQLPGAVEAVPIVENMALPEGTIILTEKDAQLHVETVPGAVATIEGDTRVTLAKLGVQRSGETVVSQEALLDLKKGNVISTIDPAKKAINHYGVRTPKGVAAARGTVYGVALSVEGTSVATLSGTVTLNLGKDALGNDVVISIPVGSAAMNDSTIVTAISTALAQAGQTTTVETLLNEAVQAVAANVANNFSSVSDPGTATAVLSAVVSAAAAAAPPQAASFTATAVTAIIASGSATAGAATNAALAAVTEAAAAAAPEAIAAITKAAVAVVVSVDSTTASSSTALAAVVEGATRADVTQASVVAAAAVAQVVETKVAEAISRARQAGGDANAVVAAAQAAATSTQASLTTVAEAAFAAVAISSNISAGTEAAATLAQSISDSVNAAASSGASAATSQAGVAIAITIATVSVDSTSVPALASPATATATPSAETTTTSSGLTSPVTPVNLPPVSGS